MINSYDTMLLEINNNPSSQAIFATMSMQLKQEGGFDRVQALLNELVDDGKKQIHEARKTFGATAARCEVSGMKFQEKQDFYENRLESAKNFAEEAQSEKANCEGMDTFLNTSKAYFAALQAAEAERHAEARNFLNGLIKSAEEGAQECDNALAQINDWNTQSPALLQASLKKITASYLQVHKFNIVVPSNFVQTAASDDTVKQRLGEWVSELKLTFLDVQTTTEGILAHKETVYGNIEAQLQELLNVYDVEVSSFADKHALFVEQVAHAEKTIELFAKLAEDNKALVAANKEYCDVEMANFEQAQKVLEEQIDLFKKIREFFQTKYAKISEFIKERYSKN